MLSLLHFLGIFGRLVASLYRIRWKEAIMIPKGTSKHRGYMDLPFFHRLWFSIAL